jgi:hypothetical protein
MQGRKDGFFLEAGALDGQLFSNSLLFEMLLGWRGLLVEAVPSEYSKLRDKHRK